MFDLFRIFFWKFDLFYGRTLVRLRETHTPLGPYSAQELPPLVIKHTHTPLQNSSLPLPPYHEIKATTNLVDCNPLSSLSLPFFPLSMLTSLPSSGTPTLAPGRRSSEGSERKRRRVTMDHPDIPDGIASERRRVEHGIHLWDGPRDPRSDYVERQFPTWPEEMQEKHFAEAVLLAARGVPSVLAAPVPQAQEENLKGRDYPPLVFLTSELVDDTLGKFADPVLGLAADRALVWRFGKDHIMEYHEGLINQAFGAALVGICLEFHEYICTVWDELQGSTAPLSVVHNRLFPYIPLFALLRDLLDKHEGKCGISVIKVLEAARTQHIGNHIGEVTLNSLLDCVCKPFFYILNAWIYEGKNIAPWEFPLTKPGSSAANFMTWELTRSGLPNFLQNCTTEILQCGKLALILREAGVSYQPQVATLMYAPNSSENTKVIREVYHQANREVLGLLRGEHRLVNRIEFLHHFLLCGSGDWVSSFMDHCWQHPNCALDRTVRDARWDELQRAMKICCEASASSKFPAMWLETLRLEPANKSLIRMVRRMARIQVYKIMSFCNSHPAAKHISTLFLEPNYTICTSTSSYVYYHFISLSSVHLLLDAGYFVLSSGWLVPYVSQSEVINTIFFFLSFFYHFQCAIIHQKPPYQSGPRIRSHCRQ